MTKCGVFACPNKGFQFYLIDARTEVWLCDECINQAEWHVKQEIEKQKELVPAG